MGLRQLLFGTWDRKIATISFISSLVSVIVTIFSLQAPGTVPYLIIVRDLCVVFGLVGISALLFYRYINREWTNRNQLQQIREIYDLAYTVVHRYRDSVFGYFLPILPDDFPFQTTQRELKLFKNICHSTTLTIRQSFLAYFESASINIGDDIAVSVKLLVPSQQVSELVRRRQTTNMLSTQRIDPYDLWAITVYRDPITYERDDKREIRQKLYSVRENTAFQHIVEGGSQYFLSNNLQAEKNYHNQNLDWQKYYNSTLVVPIRYRDKETGQQVCFGLLAVDSMNKDKLDLYNDKECFFILKHAADLLATFFLTLAALKFNNDA